MMFFHLIPWAPNCQLVLFCSPAKRNPAADRARLELPLVLPSDTVGIAPPHHYNPAKSAAANTGKPKVSAGAALKNLVTCGPLLVYIMISILILIASLGLSAIGYVNSTAGEVVVQSDAVKTGIYDYMNLLPPIRERSATKLPAETNDGVHDDKLTAKGNIGIARGFWTNGFWAGMLWQMYHATKDERYAEIARFTLPILDECLLELDTHDIGFLWLPTAVLDDTITGSAAAKQSALTASKWLMGRFNPAAEVICAWGGGNKEMALSKADPKMHMAGVTVIDCMMNLPLLYWASAETGDPRFYHAADGHAAKAMKHFVCEDGSVIHICEFDPNTGGFSAGFRRPRLREGFLLVPGAGLGSVRLHR